MNNALLSFIVLIISTSCNLNEQGNGAQSSPQIDKATGAGPISQDATKKDNTPETETIKDIRFAVKSCRTDASKDTIGIRATLYNDNTDTVYFLSTSCYGVLYSLRYNTAKFDLSPLVFCNASWPQLNSIAPKGQYPFLVYARLRRKINEQKIKLGFDFYSVDKSVYPTNEKLKSSNFFRPEKQQTIIWAEHTTIE